MPEKSIVAPLRLHRLNILQLQARIAVGTRGHLPELCARLALQIMSAQNPASFAQRMPFAVASAGKKRECGNSKIRRDVNSASVHREDLLAPGDLLAQLLEAARKTRRETLETAA